ncbi:hypothetical protein Trydic_g7568 [Trypoxylus dichotomus]
MSIINIGFNKTRLIRPVEEKSLVKINSNVRALGKVNKEDNDPKYRSKFCTVWEEQSGIVALDWPLQLPDANPIESVWAQAQASRKKSASFEAADTTCSSHLMVFTERIRSQLSSEMPDNYQWRW